MFSVLSLTDTAPSGIYTLSLHDALPICKSAGGGGGQRAARRGGAVGRGGKALGRDLAILAIEYRADERSEEHTSELQSPVHLVCRLLLEKKKHSPMATPLRQPVPMSYVK